MKFQNQALKRQAREKISSSKQEKRIVLFYAGSLCAVSVLFMLLDLLLSYLTPKTGGLSTMGTRSFLSSLSGILPVLSFLLSMCLGFGYLGGMVRISRGQFASPNALRTGFERFWPLLRLTLLKALILFGCSIGASYLSAFLFTLSPFSDRFLELAEPMLSSGSLLNEGTLILEEGTADAILAASLPMMVIFLIVMALLAVPLMYRLRLTDYVLFDHPEVGALYAIRESKRMMRNNRMAFFKLDLSFWWFYLALAVSTAISYGQTLLALVGVQLPGSPTLYAVLFFLLSCGGELAVSYCLRNQVAVTYALAYNSLKPAEPTTGAVLGNIFQM